jgi:hypothetical protein
MGACYGALGWDGMGSLAPLLSLVSFAGLLGVSAIGAVWAVQRLARGTFLRCRPTLRGVASCYPVNSDGGHAESDLVRTVTI